MLWIGGAALLDDPPGSRDILPAHNFGRFLFESLVGLEEILDLEELAIAHPLLREPCSSKRHMRKVIPFQLCPKLCPSRGDSG